MVQLNFAHSVTRDQLYQAEYLCALYLHCPSLLIVKLLASKVFFANTLVMLLWCKVSLPINFINVSVLTVIHIVSLITDKKFPKLIN